MKGRKPRAGKPKLKRNDIQGAKYLLQIVDLLRPLHEHCADPKRTLHYDEYCAYLLLYFFTPILTSMRGLQQASQFESLQRKLKLRRFSLGSFSEAGTVFDPALLVPIIEQISERLEDLPPDDPRLATLERRPTAPPSIPSFFLNPDRIMKGKRNVEDLIFNNYTRFLAIGIGYNIFFHHYRKNRDFMGMVWSMFFALILWWWPLIDDGLDLMIGLREPLDPTTNATFIGFCCVMWYVGWSFMLGLISPYTYALMGITYRKFGDFLEYLIKNID